MNGLSAVRLILWVALPLACLAVWGCGSSEVGEVGDVDMDAAYPGAETGDYSAVASALENGLDVNEPDAAGKTLLHHAAIGNQSKIAINLIEEYKADPNVKDEEGRTALDYAQQNGNQQLVSILKTAG